MSAVSEIAVLTEIADVAENGETSSDPGLWWTKNVTSLPKRAVGQLTGTTARF